jgi:putative methionine-R-sulfoxide reductase with GAF domain
MENTFTDILQARFDRAAKAKEIATLISASRGYTWVGLYDVTSEHISMIACSGDDPPYPVFPREKGLNGRAIKNKSVIMVNDVQNDADYLTTFSKTQSELIIPIIAPGSNEVVGTIDIESHTKDAFGESDIVFLQTCVQQIMPLWT